MRKLIVLSLLVFLFGISLIYAQEIICNDSDVGEDEAFIKGELSITSNGSTSFSRDFCLDEDTVSEGYCKEGETDTKYSRKSIDCDYGCFDGRCLKENETDIMPEKITEEGTYTVKKGQRIEINNVKAEIREISWALSGDTEPKVEINGNNAQICSLHVGEECTLFYGAVMHPISKNLKIYVNSIEKNEENPAESTASVTFIKIDFEEPVTYYYEEGTYIVKIGDMFEINEVEGRIREITWALAGDTEPSVAIDANNAQSVNLHTGEEKKFFIGAVTHPTAMRLLVRVNSINKNEEIPLKSTASMTFIEIDEVVVPTEETGPVDVPKEAEEIYYACYGCKLTDKCYPIGYRKSKTYCSDEEFAEQKEAGVVCENNFECKSNVCVNDECISESFIRKIIDWLKKLFGIE